MISKRNDMEIFFLQHKITLCDHGEDTNSPTLAFDRLEAGNSVNLRCTLRELAKAIKERYIFVKAAGGIIKNQQGQMLIIHREGRWDLPKGMVEPNETLAQAALREVEEETGQQICSIESTCNKSLPLAKTYHIYDKYGGWHFKQTTWFPMIATQLSDLRPQREEGIDSCQWMEPEIWKQQMETSFPSLQNLIKKL